MKSLIKIAFGISLVIAFTQTLMAQPPGSKEDKDEIEARRIGFITRELQLTPEEAQIFWPVYNKYRAEMDALRRGRSTELLSAKINFESMTDEEASKLIDNEFGFRQKELDIQRRYNTEFKKVLAVKKVAKLYRTEQLFKIQIIKDIKHDQSQGGDKVSPLELKKN